MQVEQTGARTTVLVRFPDDEILEGSADGLDLDQPDFELVLADPSTNNRRALIPLPSVKSLTLGRRAVAGPVDVAGMQKIALRFSDGEVVKGLLRGGPRRCRHGVVLDLLSPGGDEEATLGIPYSSLKAVFYLKAWDSRPAEYLNVTGQWSGRRQDPALVDLLGDIRRLADLRGRGDIGAEEFRRRRRQVLDQL